MRARGANAVKHMLFETVYGTPPGGNWNKVPFVDSNLGEEQGLVPSDLLGYGRDPQSPSRDVINDEGDATVPWDLRNIGYWLKMLCGAPDTAQGVAASGTLTFSAQPANNATITLDGTAFTFVTGTPTGNQIKIGATLAETIANAVIALNASTDGDASAATYGSNRAGNQITVTHDTLGTGGNAFTLAAGSSPASNATASGATLSGGSASGPYNHVFTTGAISLPSASIEVGLPDVPSYAVNYGAVLDALSVALQRSGNLNAKLKLIAQGETRSASSSAGTPTEQVIDRFTQFMGQVARDGVLLGEVVGGNVNISNGLDKVEVIREDGRIDGVDPGMLAVTGDITTRFSNTTLMDLASAGTAIELAFRWAISSAKRIEIKVHNVFLPKPKLPITGPAGIQATYAWQASEHPTLGKTCTITLVNDVAAY